MTCSRCGIPTPRLTVEQRRCPDLQAKSRERIRIERKGDPNWVDLGDGYFALHIQYGGGAVVIHLPGSGDAAALREWLAYHWPPDEKLGDGVTDEVSA